MTTKISALPANQQIAWASSGTATVSTPLFDGQQTWNAGGVTFTGLKFNVTNTASASASKLFDLQVAGTSYFNVSVASGGDTTVGGGLTVANNITGGTLVGNKLQATAGNTAFGGDGSGLAAAKLQIANHTNADTAGAGTALVWADNLLGQATALTATNARTYTTAATLFVAGAPVASTNVTITNPYSLYVASGNTGLLGHLLFPTDNTYDIGASGANRPRNVYVAGSITTGTAATFATTSVALTNGAGAQTATLTNGPTAGNPTKWIGINDNGTTRYIPAW